MTPQELKASILQLAIQGKLVEQAKFSEFPQTAAHPYSRRLLEAYDFFNKRARG